MSPPELTIGWDIGGAHVKAALVESPRASQPARVADVAQWACPLWQGLQHLHAAVSAARGRWPQALGDGRVTHVITMTGELVDLFEHREAGVSALADAMAAALPGALRFFAGERGWCSPAEVDGRWQEIASANWWATAAVSAQAASEDEHGAVLVDIGSTTTDLIPLRAGRVLAQGRSDAQRLARGELVYQGVVRTPLCALAPRIAHRTEVFNVMNEFFATTADVYRLSGELDPAHDQHPAADGAPKDAAATRRRLARMIGLDARDATDPEWLAFAHAWRRAQCEELRGQFERVLRAAALGPRAAVIGAGCGDFLAAQLAADTGRAYRRFESLLADAEPTDSAAHRRAWMQVGAPAVAVAWLWATGWQGAGSGPGAAEAARPVLPAHEVR